MDNHSGIHAMKKLLQPAIVCWLIFSLICGWIVARSQFTADMSAFLPRDPSARQQILIDQISEGFASRALIVAIEGAPAPVLAQLSGNLGQQLRQSTHFSSVNNGQSTTAEKDQALLVNNRYLLSPAMGPQRMSVDGLRAAVMDSLAEIGSATGLFSKALLGKDPTGESIELIKRVIPAAELTQLNGVWMNADKSRAMLLLQTRAQGSDLDAQEAAHAAILQGFAQAKNAGGADAASAKLQFSGPSVFAVNSRDTIRSEATRLSSIGTLLVLCLLWLIYRSLTTLFLGIIPVVTGAVAGIAAVGLGFPAVHGMTLGFGITLIGEAVDYAIYLFMQHTRRPDDGAHSADQRAQSFAQSFWPTIRLGVLTSVFGFSTLLLSGFTGLAQLGLFSITGIVVAALVTRFVLPKLLPAGFYVRQPVRLGQFLKRAAHMLARLKPAALVMLLVCLAVIALRWETLWSVELGGLSPVPSAAQQLDAELRAQMGAADSGLLVVLQAPSSEEALQLSEQVSARLEPLVASGVLGGFEAPSVYLPSVKTQLQRQASLPDADELKKRTSLALTGLPLQADKLEEFFADVARSKARQPLTRADLDDSSLGLGVDALLSSSSRTPARWTALVVLRAPQPNAAERSIDITTIQQAVANVGNAKDAAVYVMALRTEAGDLYRAYLQEAIRLTAAGFAAIVVLLFITFRSWRHVARVVLPLLVAMVTVAAIIVQVKGSLSLLHLVGLLLVMAVGSNYALFFNQPSQKANPSPPSDNDNDILCSLLFANLTTVLGFGLLAFSSVPVMNAIGLTVGLGTFLALILSAIFSNAGAWSQKPETGQA